MRPPERRLALAGLLGLALVLTVVVAAAGIRLGAGAGGLRVIHRVAASLEVVVVLWLIWMAWRLRASRPDVFRAALLALFLTAFLSVVGIVGGQSPPPAGAAANLLGGLALVSVFAWIAGKMAEKWGQTPFSLREATENGVCPHFFRGLSPFFLTPVLILLGVQLALGAWLSIVDRFGAVLPAHGVLAMVLAGSLAWIALARIAGGGGKALCTLALAAPLAGFTTLQYEHSSVAAVVHAAAAALLLAAATYALGRRA